MKWVPPTISFSKLVLWWWKHSSYWFQCKIFSLGLGARSITGELWFYWSVLSMVSHNAAHPSWTTFFHDCVPCSFQCCSNRLKIRTLFAGKCFLARKRNVGLDYLLEYRDFFIRNSICSCQVLENICQLLRFINLPINFIYLFFKKLWV